MAGTEFPRIKLALPDLLGAVDSDQYCWKQESTDKYGIEHTGKPSLRLEKIQRKLRKTDSEFYIFESYYESIFSKREKSHCIAPSSSYDGQSFNLFCQLYLRWLNEKYKCSLPEPIVCTVLSERKQSDEQDRMFSQSAEKTIVEESNGIFVTDRFGSNNPEFSETLGLKANRQLEEPKDKPGMLSATWNDFLSVYANFASFVLKAEGFSIKDGKGNLIPARSYEEQVDNIHFMKSTLNSYHVDGKCFFRDRLNICFILAILELNLEFSVAPESNDQDLASYAASVLSMFVLTLTKSKEGLGSSRHHFFPYETCMASLRKAGIISILLRLLYKNYHKSYIEASDLMSPMNKLIILNSLSTLSCLISMETISFARDLVDFNTDTAKKECLMKKSPLLFDIPFLNDTVKNNTYMNNGTTILFYTLEISLKGKDFNLVCATIEILISLLQRTQKEASVLHREILYRFFTYDKVRSSLYEENISHRSKLSPVFRKEVCISEGVVYDEEYNYDKYRHTYLLDQLQIHLNSLQTSSRIPSKSNEKHCENITSFAATSLNANTCQGDVAFQGPVSRNLRQTKLIVNTINALERFIETIIHHYTILKDNPYLRALREDFYFQQIFYSLSGKRLHNNDSSNLVRSPFNFKNDEKNVNETYFIDSKSFSSPISQHKFICDTVKKRQHNLVDRKSVV